MDNDDFKHAQEQQNKAMCMGCGVACLLCILIPICIIAIIIIIIVVAVGSAADSIAENSTYYSSAEFSDSVDAWVDSLDTSGTTTDPSGGASISDTLP